jgi:long-subunit acyl-CoA synthetase (AMP-forming)
MTSDQPFFLGIISGERRRSHAQVADRAGRIAGGLQKLGVSQGDSVCLLMRNDIAFIEAAYAVALLGAYAVPVNWHFKPEEITYVLKDSGTRVLIGHADICINCATRFPLVLPCSVRQRRLRFWRTTRSIRIIWRRLKAQPIWSTGCFSKSLTTARHCQRQ